ncbi:MAG: transposase [Spirochaetia bacterium]|jgi:transposase|nr:transposase [Spirochaetia bacterium]
MMGLVLVLDTRLPSLPVWFDIIPGNLLDVSTVMGIVEDVESSLCISVGSLTLDAGYASKKIIRAFSDCGDKFLILRMPARKRWN